MEEKRNTFPKKEHLCGKTTIASLFQKGKSFLSYPIKICYQVSPDKEPVRLLIVAPKKKFKHAVDRNRVKRQLREAYRKNKHELVDLMTEKGEQLHVAFLYVDNQILPSHVVEHKITIALNKLIERLK